ncbi:MAG TPA: RNA pseudouridine synthase [Dongiaceae bacterium]|jgi:RluA family pseudouridine synthase|nr:RNA pseudouridine synthase [Dongiaceae bacterium]
MAKPQFIELDDGKSLQHIPILYEDRSALAVDKPAGWMLVPFSWQNTNRNLMAALTSSIAAGDFWARSRGLKFLRNVHRLDADTTGILLFAKSLGAVEPFTDLFETRHMDKIYLAVVLGVPKQPEWTCEAPLAPDPRQIGKVRVDFQEGKDAVTHFKVLQTRTTPTGPLTLVEAHPVTGRTHQIRVHLAHAGTPVTGDKLYGPASKNPGPTYSDGRPKRRPNVGPPEPLGLRSIYLAYRDPFQKRPVEIKAPTEAFLQQFGFPDALKAMPEKP